MVVSSDEFKRNEKHKKTYFTYEQRKQLLEAIRYVDLAIPEENWQQKRSDMHEYHVDTFVMGDDWKGKFDFLKEEGVEVVYLPRTPEISTSQIKHDLYDANGADGESQTPHDDIDTDEMYSKDLSKKIQSCFRSKEARGEIYTPVPFGYKRNQQNHLILDEEVSDVVVRIFLWKKSGMKEREIAKKLSAQGIPTPFTRRCQLGYLKNTLRVKDPAWQTVFVTKVLENPIYTGTMVYNRIAYDETNRKIGQNPRESWRMVPDSHPAIISWELFDEVSALREAEQAVKEERKKWCRQRRKNNPNIFKGRIFCKKCGEKLVCHWQSDGTLYFYCASCHVSISEKDLWNGINKELHQRMEEHRDLQKLARKSSGRSKFQSKEIATKREIEQASGNIVRLESQKRSGYEQYVLGKISKEKFLELKQDAENEIEAFRQTKAENEKELVVVQEELRQKKQIADNTEVLLTADNLQQYVKKIEVDREKITCTEFSF